MTDEVNILLIPDKEDKNGMKMKIKIIQGAE